jgi:large subunit ribosomal protein L22
MVAVAAKLKHTRMSAQKCRLVCDVIRGLPVDKALDVLQFSKKKAAAVVKKVLESAIANAAHNEGADVDDLVVQSIFADQAASLRRMHPRAKGRSSRISKPTCHITIIVSDKGRS